MLVCHTVGHAVHWMKTTKVCEAQTKRSRYAVSTQKTTRIKVLKENTTKSGLFLSFEAQKDNDRASAEVVPRSIFSPLGFCCVREMSEVQSRFTRSLPASTAGILWIVHGSVTAHSNSQLNANMLQRYGSLFRLLLCLCLS